MSETEEAQQNVATALAVIEGTNTIADLLDGMRTGLVERGWSVHNAEIAAIEFYRIERTR